MSVSNFSFLAGLEHTFLVMSGQVRSAQWSGAAAMNVGAAATYMTVIIELPQAS